MRHSIDEAVMLLAAAQFAHKKDCVDHHASDKKSKKHDPKKQQNALAPVENDPSNIQRDSEGNKSDAQAEKKDDRSATARDPHARYE